VTTSCHGIGDGKVPTGASAHGVVSQTRSTLIVLTTQSCQHGVALSLVIQNPYLACTVLRRFARRRSAFIDQPASIPSAGIIVPPSRQAIDPGFLKRRLCRGCLATQARPRI
jgi:hypothetical protein